MSVFCTRKRKTDESGFSCVLIYKLSFTQMAEVVPEKSHGLKFAEQQLKRHGWEQGEMTDADIQPLQCSRLLHVSYSVHLVLR